MYASEKPEAKRKRASATRARWRDTGMAAIVLVLPKERVAELDAAKKRRGLRNRSQVIEMLLTGKVSRQQIA